MTIQQDLDRIKELEGKATGGEWFWDSYGSVQSLNKKASYKHPLSLVGKDEKNHVILGICRSQQPSGFQGDEVSSAYSEAGDNMELIATLRNKALKMVRVIEHQKDALRWLYNTRKYDKSMTEAAGDALTETEKIWEGE